MSHARAKQDCTANQRLLRGSWTIMPIAGFIDYVAQRTLEIAKDPDVDFDVAARAVDLIANFDRDALRRAEAGVRRRLFNEPGDQILRRGHKLLRMALELHSAGPQSS